MRIALLDLPSFTVPYDHELARSLAGRGHDVTLLAAPFAFGEVPAPDGYRREEVFFSLSARLVKRLGVQRSRGRLALKALDYPPSVLRLMRRIRALRPDVVHVQWLSAAQLDIHWLRRVAARYPTVLTAHDVIPRRHKGVGAWTEALRAVDRVIAHSQRAVDDLASLGVDRARIECIPHAVFDGPDPGDPRPPSGARLLFFGLIRENKGVDVLLRALVDVPGAELVIVGDPVDPVEPLRELAGQLGVAERVDWRLGFVPDEEIPALMDEATLVVLPYRRIDSSGVLATALGHGRPVVVTDVGALPDAVAGFGAGRVVPPEDPAALAAACRALLDDPAALARAFEGALAARAALTWEAAAAEHERVYREVVASR